VPPPTRKTTRTPKGAFSPHDNSIPALQRRGPWSSSPVITPYGSLRRGLIATEVTPDELSHDALAAELTNHLIAGVVLTPGMVGTLPELQRSGFNYAKFGLTAFAGCSSGPGRAKGGRDDSCGDGYDAAPCPQQRRSASGNGGVAAIALLSVRFIQGFIYWGGGSRRFIYGPDKLDPDAHTWMANKFQTAMPGATASVPIT